MKALFVVDLQREFVKDSTGKKIYQTCLDYIKRHRMDYDKVLAAVYINKNNFNMSRYVNWNEMDKKCQPLDFTPDDYATHSGYALLKYPFGRESIVDVIGFDTDACVLNACFDLFNRDVQFRILINGCWSSGGKAMHEAGLKVMKRQFAKAVDEKTRIDV